MKIAVVGTRGIAQIPGGIEMHCRELYPRVVALGCDVFVMCRKCYIDEDNIEYNGVKLVHLYALKNKYFETILHSLFGIIKARILNVDILHIHAIGSALLIPFARFIGIKHVVVTHHGQDYAQKAWGIIAKRILRMGELYCAKLSDEVIVISENIYHGLQQLHHRNEAHLILNGINAPKKIQTTKFITSLGLKSGKYVLAIGNFIPENGLDLLIDAFRALMTSDYQLVIAGDVRQTTEYSEKLREQAMDAKVILTGYVTGSALAEILTHARLYVSPSYQAGVSIGLLKAMSYNLEVLVGDTSSTKTMQLPYSSYFSSGDKGDLSDKLREKLSQPSFSTQYDMSSYNWEYVAQQTVDIYHKMIMKDAV